MKPSSYGSLPLAPEIDYLDGLTESEKARVYADLAAPDPDSDVHTARGQSQEVMGQTSAIANEANLREQISQLRAALSAARSESAARNLQTTILSSHLAEAEVRLDGLRHLLRAMAAWSGHHD